MALAPMKLHKELEKLFGPDDAPTIPSFYINQLLRLTWSGKMGSEGVRPLCWRVFLGLISNTDKGIWKQQLNQQIVNYNALKEKIMPSLDKVKADPLSSLLTAGGQSEEWNAFHKNTELSNFIKGDLDRLYLTGIEEDEYFQSKSRRTMLQSILFLWSLQHPSTSYRQGMHELVGCVLYVIELERQEWDKAFAKKEVSANHSLYGVFSEASLEAHTYYLFERLMVELQPLYDPTCTLKHGTEGQPFVVQFCTKIQEHYLRILEPDLCAVLEDSYVQAQLYGLRWSRLMLGREFAVTSEQLFVLWDYMFCSSYDAEFNAHQEDLTDESTPANVYSMLAVARLLGNRKDKNSSLKNESSEKFTYVVTPLLGALGDFMLAMLLHIKPQVMESDASSVMGYLMHYPELESVVPVIELVDMIRRGVMIQESALFAQPSNASDFTPSKSPPSWLLKSTMPMHGVGKKMSEKFSAVKSAVGNGLNSLVDSLAEYGDLSGQSPTELHYAHKDGQSAPNTKNTTSSTSSSNSNSKISSAHAPVITTAAPIPVVTNEPVKPMGDFDPLMGTNVSSSSNSNNSSSKTGRITPVNSSSSAVKPVASKAAEPSTTAARRESATINLEDLYPPTPQTGLGTGYGSFKDSQSPVAKTKKGAEKKGGNADDSSDLRQSSTATLPVTPSRHGSINMFTPTSWFPSASSSSNNAGTLSKKEIKRDKRTSGGVDLHVLQTNMKSASAAIDSDNQLTNTHNKHDKHTPAKSSALANNNCVGDRLLDIADSLLTPQYRSLSTALLEGRELECEAELRKETARRLRALADVLAGLSNIVEYDTKFANQQPGSQALLAAQTAAAAAAVAAPFSAAPVSLVDSQTTLSDAQNGNSSGSGGSRSIESGGGEDYSFLVEVPTPLQSATEDEEDECCSVSETGKVTAAAEDSVAEPVRESAEVATDPVEVPPVAATTQEAMNSQDTQNAPPSDSDILPVDTVASITDSIDTVLETVTVAAVSLVSVAVDPTRTEVFASPPLSREPSNKVAAAIADLEQAEEFA